MFGDHGTEFQRQLLAAFEVAVKNELATMDGYDPPELAGIAVVQRMVMLASQPEQVEPARLFMGFDGGVINEPTAGLGEDEKTEQLSRELAAERARMDALYVVIDRCLRDDHDINVTRLHDYCGREIGLPADAVDGGPTADV